MNRTVLSRAIATVLLGSAVVFSGPVAADHHGERGRQAQGEQGPRKPMTEAEREQFRARMQARVNERLDQLGSKLAITPAQQEAWNGYRKARTGMFATRFNRPAADADAVTVARHRAERAQQRAQHLASVADATTRLYQVLDGSQRKLLDEASRHRGMRGHGPQRAEAAGVESAV